MQPIHQTKPINNPGPVALLVEEEACLQESLGDLLKQNQFSVLRSSNCQEALELLKLKKVDLLLISGLSPNQDTFDFVCHFRQELKTKNIPLVLLSTFYRSPRFDELAESFPKTKYLVSPIPKTELLETLREFLA